MKLLTSLFLLLLASAAQAADGDCEKAAAYKYANAKRLQGDYLRQVPREQWAAFLKESNSLLRNRYQADLAACKTPS